MVKLVKQGVSEIRTDRVRTLVAPDPDSWRAGLTTAQRGYGSRWQRERERYLRANPLCVYCQQAGIVTAATVVDHIIPHRGDQKLFWRQSNWQSLCATHHSSEKQRQERKDWARPI